MLSSLPVPETDLELIYEALNTPGWDLLLAEFEELHRQANQIASVSSLEDLHFRRGQLAALNYLLSLKDDVRGQLDAAL